MSLQCDLQRGRREPHSLPDIQAECAEDCLYIVAGHRILATLYTDWILYRTTDVSPTLIISYYQDFTQQRPANLLKTLHTII